MFMAGLQTQPHWLLTGTRPQLFRLVQQPKLWFLKGASLYVGFVAVNELPDSDMHDC